MRSGGDHHPDDLPLRSDDRVPMTTLLGANDDQWRWIAADWIRCGEAIRGLRPPIDLYLP